MVWQNAIIAVAVTVATAYIAVQIWRTISRKTLACCDKGCSAKQEVVQISLGSTIPKNVERN